MCATSAEPGADRVKRRWRWRWSTLPERSTPPTHLLATPVAVADSTPRSFVGMRHIHRQTLILFRRDADTGIFTRMGTWCHVSWKLINNWPQLGQVRYWCLISCINTPRRQHIHMWALLSGSVWVAVAVALFVLWWAKYMTMMTMMMIMMMMQAICWMTRCIRVRYIKHTYHSHTCIRFKNNQTCHIGLVVINMPNCGVRGPAGSNLTADSRAYHDCVYYDSHCPVIQP